MKFSLHLHCILTSISGQFSCSISSYYTVFCPICLIALLSFPPKINLDSLFPIILALFDTVNLDYSKLCCSETDHLHVSQGKVRKNRIHQLFADPHPSQRWKNLKNWKKYLHAMNRLLYELSHVTIVKLLLLRASKFKPAIRPPPKQRRAYMENISSF